MIPQSQLKRLTVVAPRELEDPLAAALIDMQPPLPGFTVIHVAGHGEGFQRASVRESVRGRIERLQLWMVLPEPDVQRVLDRLGERFAHSQIVWWVEPVDAMGRLA